MNYLQKFTRQFSTRLLLLFILSDLILVGNWLISHEIFKFTGNWLLLALAVLPLLSLTFLPWLSTKYLTQPTKLIWQAILHITPHSEENVPAPNTKSLHFGKELVDSLTAELYQLATVADTVTTTLERKNANLSNNSVANDIPLPLLVLDGAQTIIFANIAAQKYLDMKPADLVGKNVYSMLNLSFETDETFDVWLNKARANSVTDSRNWSRVRLSLAEPKKTLLFDLAAYYTKASSAGYETLLTLFDHTQQYSHDDQAMDFIALAVHELRTPLTLIRGYVEALEEDAAGKLSTNEAEFLKHIDAGGQQLAAFVNNILNVARIEDDQLSFQLHEEQWPVIIESAVRDMQLRASVHDITIESEVAPNLPSVGVDRIGIYEVLSNLLDNAIKYSVDSKKVILKTHLTNDGLVETTIEDFGAGIPENIVPHLFDKFYRNHHTRTKVSGTGLGLYLSKVIVSAHGGHIWIRSKENEGSIFGFTILPYAKLSGNSKDRKQDFTRTAHGWIKNHSLYRR